MIEEADPETGLVTGKVVGLSGDLHRHIETIQNYCRDTHPVPVGVRIIEEGTATRTPFLRLEIWPTFAPHYDSAGRRPSATTPQLAPSPTRSLN